MNGVRPLWKTRRRTHFAPSARSRTNSICRSTCCVSGRSRFRDIKPMKRGGGRRYYRPDDVDLLRGIRHLLYGEGYTIRGVQRILREQGAQVRAGGVAGGRAAAAAWRERGRGIRRGGSLRNRDARRGERPARPACSLIGRDLGDRHDDGRAPRAAAAERADAAHRAAHESRDPRGGCTPPGLPCAAAARECRRGCRAMICAVCTRRCTSLPSAASCSTPRSAHDA